MPSDHSQLTAHHLAWIALGSNIAPQKNLPLAVKTLAELGAVIRTSSVWESAPVGDVHQANFCNAAVQLRTQFPAHELKDQLREMESRLGRIRDPANKNAARTIDLDIAFFDDLIRHDQELSIPDPEIAHRPFLAVPLAELDPEFRHPELNQTLRTIATAAGGTSSLSRRDDLPLRVES